MGLYLCCYTQITQLKLTWVTFIPRAVLLPDGSNVNLQRLSLTAAKSFSSIYAHQVDKPDSQAFGQLDNLQAATQLTYIKFVQAYPDNLEKHGWPASMPKLQIIKGDCLPSGPPEQLVGYSNLRKLDLCCHSQNTGRVMLASWLSQLTQLESLALRADLSAFPSCILHLRQLQKLDLSNCGLTKLQLPASVLEFIDFLALTYLGLCEDVSTEVSSVTERLLDLLKHSLPPDCFDIE